MSVLSGYDEALLMTLLMLENGVHFRLKDYQVPFQFLSSTLLALNTVSDDTSRNDCKLMSVFSDLQV